MKWSRTDLGYQNDEATILRVLVVRPSRGRRRCDRGRQVTEVKWVPYVRGVGLGVACSRLKDAKQHCERARLGQWITGDLRRSA